MSVYEQFGVPTIINACGTVTRLGGAPMPPDVINAFVEAASEWVTLEHMQAAASRRIAAATGTEAGLVTSGSAASLTLGAAAILAGHNLRRIEQLPHCDDFPHELIIAREQRSGYDHAIRASGARLVEVGFNEIVSNAGVRRTEAWEYEAAITDQTAGIVYGFAADSCPRLEDVVEVAHRHNLPVLVDAAGEVPPRGNLADIPARGADLVGFSGGKGIRGPQSTGILCGRRDLISSAALQMLDMDDHFELWDPPQELIDRSKLTGIPRHGIGRALKVSKEEIVALLTALDLFVSGAYEADNARYENVLATVSAALSSCAASTCIIDSESPDRWPILEITVDEQQLGRSTFDVCKNLRNANPPVYVGHGKLALGILVVNPVCLNDETAGVLARILQSELTI